MSDETRRAPARALATFFASVSPRLLAELEACGALAGADAAAAGREWQAVVLHACVRGVVADAPAGAPDAAADLVDGFHQEVLGFLAPPAEHATWRAMLAERYAEYDGVARTLGQKGATLVPAAVARAFARHAGVADARVTADAVAPLLEAIADGAAASLADRREPGVPPIEGLRRVTDRLDAAGIEWAVGASGLLASLGLVDQVNDWDVQVEVDPDELRALYADLPHEFHGHGGCHADWKLAFDAEKTELIPRFAFFVPGGVVRVRMHVSGRWRDLPIASPEGWAVAYAIMGMLDEPSLRERRAARSEMLFAWLATNGADGPRIDELLAEPLPGSIATRLAALPRRKAG